MDKEFFSEVLPRILLVLLLGATFIAGLVVLSGRAQKEAILEIQRSEAKARNLLKKYDIETLSCNQWDTCTAILTRKGKLYKVVTENGQVYGWKSLD